MTAPNKAWGRVTLEISRPLTINRSVVVEQERCHVAAVNNSCFLSLSCTELTNQDIDGSGDKQPLLVAQESFRDHPEATFAEPPTAASAGEVLHARALFICPLDARKTSTLRNDRFRYRAKKAEVPAE